MSNRKIDLFSSYLPTTIQERLLERRKLYRMSRTKQYDNWLIKMFYYQKDTCFYCDEQVFYAERSSYHIDHRIPIYYGGKSEYSNLCISCKMCNLTKGTQQLVRNKGFLDANNMKRYSRMVQKNRKPNVKLYT